MEKDLLQEEVNILICREKGKTFLKRYQESLEEEQKEVFLDGYRYAIHVLQEGLIDSRRK